MWTELEQLNTVPVHPMLVPVRPFIFAILTTFQDLRVCQSPNGRYITYEDTISAVPAGHIFYNIIVICNIIGEI